jgi:hypothetical protein
MVSTGGPNDDLDSVVSASSAQSSSSPRQLSLRAEPHPTEIQTTTIPGAAIRGDQEATAERRDHTSQYGVELDAQSRTHQVSPRIRA